MTSSAAAELPDPADRAADPDGSDRPDGPDPAAPVRRRGRRPAGEDTRGLILVAARSEFGSRGYDNTTMRGVARAAGVDPRLVHHYFDGKEELFVTALGFPARPAELLPALLAGPVEEIGERLARTVFQVWESPEGKDRLVGLLSGALSSEAAARMVREFVTRELLGRIAAHLQMDRSELRAALAASHLVGLAMGRLVIKIEPLADADLDELARIVGPVLQRYLTDPELPV